MASTIMEAKIFHVQPSHLLGRNSAGETVFFANKGEVRDAKVGDTLFFNPEKPSMVSRGGVKWFGKNATLTEFAPEPEPPEPTRSTLTSTATLSSGRAPAIWTHRAVSCAPPVPKHAND